MTFDERKEQFHPIDFPIQTTTDKLYIQHDILDDDCDNNGPENIIEITKISSPIKEENYHDQCATDKFAFINNNYMIVNNQLNEFQHLKEGTNQKSFCNNILNNIKIESCVRDDAEFTDISKINAYENKEDRDDEEDNYKEKTEKCTSQFQDSADQKAPPIVASSPQPLPNEVLTDLEKNLCIDGKY